jgi:hypothetical protein
MKEEKIINACKKYGREFKELRFLCSTVKDLDHLEWMTEQIPKFLAEGRKEKANRWLGFIQGSLWSKNIYTIDQMKEHNRPD